MEDYIKRSDALNFEWEIECEPDDLQPMMEGMARVMDYIKKLPAADVVEVVRCRECRWWDKIGDSPIGYCHACKHGYHSSNWEISIYRTYKGDFFCADGEREGADNA